MQPLEQLVCNGLEYCILYYTVLVHAVAGSVCAETACSTVIVSISTVALNNANDE